MADAGPDNPFVLGFFTEQVLLGEIARSGLSALGRGWEEKMSFQSFGGFIPTLPREAREGAIMYVPIKSNFKGIDTLFVKLVRERRGERGKFKAIVVPTQITIAESHSDSEAAFFRTWPQYELELGSLGFISSVEIIFLWIVEKVPAGHQAKEIEPKGSRTLKGDGTDHPDFVRRWMTVHEASAPVGRLLKGARSQSTVNTFPIVLPARLSPALGKTVPDSSPLSSPPLSSPPLSSPSAPVPTRRSTRAAAVAQRASSTAAAVATTSSTGLVRRRKGE